MPPPNPITRLEQLAREIERFADELEVETDLDSTLMRHWARTIIAIAADLQGAGREEA